MLCYRDMTFCPHVDCRTDCSRKATEQVKQAAEQFGLPLCLFAEKPGCYKRPERN